MSIFEKLKQLQADYIACKEQLFRQRGVVDKVIESVQDRIETDKKLSVARIAELSELIQDSERPETVRKLYSAEIESIKKLNFAPSEEERTAFNFEVAEYETAVKDIKSIEKKLRDTASEAKREIDNIKNLVNKLDSSTFPYWISGSRERFENLNRKVDEI